MENKQLSLEDVVARVCGLNHSIRHLEEVKARIHEFPIEKQAEYADVICRANATNLAFASNIGEGSDQFDRWNTTAVGNSAYMALHAPTEELRRTYLGILQGYNEWARRRSSWIPSFAVSCSVQ